MTTTDLYQEGKISIMEYVLFSEEYSQAYIDYCRDGMRHMNDSSARAFLDMYDQEIEAHLSQNE